MDSVNFLSVAAVVILLLQLSSAATMIYICVIKSTLLIPGVFRNRVSIVFAVNLLTRASSYCNEPSSPDAKQTLDHNSEARKRNERVSSFGHFV